jgi:hypothetical protein
LRGRVAVAPLDEPVAGAEVRAFSGHRSAVGPAVVAGPDGRFEIPNVNGLARVEAVVRATGRATLVREIPLGPDGADVVLRFEPGGVLWGHVRDASGAPLPGVKVTVASSPGRLPPDPGRGPLPLGSHDEYARALAARAWTDADGRYEVHGIAVPSTVAPFAEVTPRWVTPGSAAAFTAAGQRLERDLVVPAAGTLRVTVVGWTAGEAGRATVLAQGPGGLEVYATDADRTGPSEWILAGLSAGAYEVYFAAAGSPFLIGRVTLAPAGAAEARLVFGRTPLRGVVLDGDRPVADAHVWWQGPESTTTTTNERGEFELTGLGGEPGTLVVRGPGPGPTFARSVLEDVRPGREPVRVPLPRAPTVGGRIEATSRGRDVAVTAYSPAGMSGSGFRTAEDGSFSIPLHDVRIRVLLVWRLEGSAPLLVEVPPLEPGGRFDVGTLRFDAGRTLAVSVVDEAGRPLPDAAVDFVDAWSEEFSPSAQKTDEGGVARFSRLARAALTVRAAAPGRPPGYATVPRTASTFDLRLGRGGVLALRVLTREGAPADRASILLFPSKDYGTSVPDEVLTHVETDAGGFREARLAAGSYRVRARAGTSYASAEAGPFEVREGETTTAEVRLR